MKIKHTRNIIINIDVKLLKDLRHSPENNCPTLPKRKNS